MAQTGDDCYFYYYSQCKYGNACPFRHSPQALGTETVCTLWRSGTCTRPMCKFRHMKITMDRSTIPCFWETRPGGCKKPHCVFKHFSIKKDTTAVSLPADVMPPASRAQQGEKAESKPQEAVSSFASRDMHRSSPKIDPVVVNCEDDSDMEMSPVKKLQREPAAPVSTASPSAPAAPNTQAAQAPARMMISTRKPGSQLSSNGSSSDDKYGVKTLDKILRERLLKKYNTPEESSNSEEEQRSDENHPNAALVGQSDLRFTKIVNRSQSKIPADAREVITDAPVLQTRRVVDVGRADAKQQEVASIPSVQPGLQTARQSPPKISVLQRLGKKVEFDNKLLNENIEEKPAQTSIVLKRRSPVEGKMQTLNEIRPTKASQQPSVEASSKPRKIRRVMLVDNAADNAVSDPEPKPMPAKPAGTRIQLNRGPPAPAGQSEESQSEDSQDSLKGVKAPRMDKQASRVKREIQLYVPPPRKRNGDSSGKNASQELAPPAKKQRVAAKNLSSMGAMEPERKKLVSLKRPSPDSPTNNVPEKKMTMSEAKAEGVIIKSYAEIMAEKQRKIMEQKQREGSGSPQSPQDSGSPPYSKGSGSSPSRFFFKPVIFDLQGDGDASSSPERTTTLAKRNPSKWRKTASGSSPSSIPSAISPPTKATEPSVQVPEVSSSPSLEDSHEVSSSISPRPQAVTCKIPIRKLPPSPTKLPFKAVSSEKTPSKPTPTSGPERLLSSEARMAREIGITEPLESTTPFEEGTHQHQTDSADTDSVEERSYKEQLSINSLIDDPLFQDDEFGGLSGADDIDDSELLQDIDKLLE